MSSLKYCKTLRANILEPEVYHLNPKKSDNLQFRKFVRSVIVCLPCDDWAACLIAYFSSDWPTISYLHQKTSIAVDSGSINMPS